MRMRTTVVRRNEIIAKNELDVKNHKWRGVIDEGVGLRCRIRQWLSHRSRSLVQLVLFRIRQCLSHRGRSSVHLVFLAWCTTGAICAGMCCVSGRCITKRYHQNQHTIAYHSTWHSDHRHARGWQRGIEAKSAFDHLGHFALSCDSDIR